MTKLLLFNKPYGVLSQFSGEQVEHTLANFIALKNVYPAGRLDKDSEGLLLLTDAGELQHRISNPAQKMEKTYWVQVEGQVDAEALARLQQGVMLKDGRTRPAKARQMVEPLLWPRHPPIRFRRNIPTSWIELTLREGRNRQVRRMTAATGFPTLRLVRVRIGDWHLGDLQPGQWRLMEIPGEKQHNKAGPNGRRGTALNRTGNGNRRGGISRRGPGRTSNRNDGKPTT